MDKTFSQGEPITASDHVAMNTETDAEVAEADASEIETENHPALAPAVWVRPSITPSGGFR